MKKLLCILLLIVIATCGCKLYKSNSNIVADEEDIQDDKRTIIGENKIEETKNDISDEKRIQDTKKDIQDAEQPITLYHGIPLNSIDQKVDISASADVTLKQKLLAKYDREYNLYSNNSFLAKALGKVEERGLDYCWQVTFTPDISKSEVAISQSYNPYPRNISIISSNFQGEFNINGNVLKEINNRFNVNSHTKELCYVDLDGDGENEYLAFVVDENYNFFAKCLLDTKYNIISYLTVFKEKCEDFNAVVESNNLLDSSEIIDINNDGIMEIIASLPAYEGFLFKVLTYKYGIFDGDLITESSLQP